MSISSEIMRFSAGKNASPPKGLGQRYDATQFLLEAGNTVVCHLNFKAAAHSAVLEARARMQALPEAGRFLYTDASSLHMTVFEGVIETRRTRDAWPADMDRNATVDAVTRSLLPRFTDFSPPPSFAVRVAGLRPTGLILEGATEQDRRNMIAWREALTVPFGYRHDDHDAYRFHMTFAYPIDWLPDALLQVWDAEFRAILADLIDAAPIIPLRPPAFCKFADMQRFDELLGLEDQQQPS